jgi:hypothetical protein
VLPQVLGARATDEAQRTDSPRDQARVRLLADAHDAIDALLQQMHRAKARPELQAQIGVAGEKLRERWNDEQPPERARHIDA